MDQETIGKRAGKIARGVIAHSEVAIAASYMTKDYVSPETYERDYNVRPEFVRLCLKKYDSDPVFRRHVDDLKEKM